MEAKKAELEVAYRDPYIATPEALASRVLAANSSERGWKDHGTAAFAAPFAAVELATRAVASNVDLAVGQAIRKFAPPESHQQAKATGWVRSGMKHARDEESGLGPVNYLKGYFADPATKQSEAAAAKKVLDQMPARLLQDALTWPGIKPAEFAVIKQILDTRKTVR